MYHKFCTAVPAALRAEIFSFSTAPCSCTEGLRRRGTTTGKLGEKKQ